MKSENEFEKKKSIDYEAEMRLIEARMKKNEEQRQAFRKKSSEHLKSIYFIFF